MAKTKATRETQKRSMIAKTKNVILMTHKTKDIKNDDSVKKKSGCKKANTMPRMKKKAPLYLATSFTPHLAPRSAPKEDPRTPNDKKSSNP